MVIIASRRIVELYDYIKKYTVFNSLELQYN